MLHLGTYLSKCSITFKTAPSMFATSLQRHDHAHVSKEQDGILKEGTLEMRESVVGSVFTCTTVA